MRRKNMFNRLKTDKLSKSFGHHKVFENISITIPTGKIVTVLGKNGSGKTTLIKVLLNMIDSNSSQVYYDNEDTRKMGAGYYHKATAVLESVDNMYNYLTGKENLCYFLTLYASNLAIMTVIIFRS